MTAFQMSGEPVVADELILVEFREDVPAALALKAERTASGARVVVVGLRPDAIDALDAAGDPGALAAHIGQQSLMNAAAGDALARAVQLAELLERRLSSSGAAPSGFSPLACVRHDLIVLLDSWAFAALQLQSITRAVRRVHYFWSNDFLRPSWSLDAADSVCARICRHLEHPPQEGRPAWADGCDVTGRPSAVRRRRVFARIHRVEGRTPVERAWKRQAWLQDRARSLRAQLRRCRKPRWRGADRGTESPALFVGGGRDLALVRGFLESHGPVWHWHHRLAAPESQARRLAPVQPTPATTTTGPDLWAWFRADAGVADLLRFADISMLELAPQTWQHYFETQLPATEALFESALSYLDQLAPVVVIHGETGAWEQTVLEAARRRRVPTVFYQWGGNYGYVEQQYLEVNELRSDGMLAYTSAVADRLSRQVRASPWARADVRAAGSPYFAHLAERLPSSTRSATRAPVCYYVPNMLAGFSRYGPHHAIDDALYHGVQKKIVATLAERFPGRLVLKPYPARREAFDPIEDWIARRRLPVVVDRRPLERVLDEADLWVIDAPATTLQQVLLTGRPVVYVHTGGTQFYPEARALLEADVAIVDAWHADFENALRRAVDEAHTRPAERRFLRTYVGDGRPAEAICAGAAEEILQFARAVPPGGRAWRSAS